MSIGRGLAHLQGESGDLATTYPTGFTPNPLGRHHAIHAHLLKEPSTEVAKRSDPEAAPAYWGAWQAYIGAMAQAGIVVHGNGLQEPSTARKSGCVTASG